MAKKIYRLQQHFLKFEIWQFPNSTFDIETNRAPKCSLQWQNIRCKRKQKIFGKLILPVSDPAIIFHVTTFTGL